MNNEDISGKNQSITQSMTAFWKRLLSNREGAPSPKLPATAATREWKRVAALLNASVSENDGESNALERISQLLAFYSGANDADKRLFLEKLSTDFSSNDSAIRKSIQDYLAATDADQRTRAIGELFSSLESPRLRILRQFNLLPNGIHALVDLRADMFRLAKGDELLALDQDLLRLFTAWFDIGFLELKRIGWGSPASLLEKLIRYEAVHEIKSWSDLRNRLDSDRRCYAFFHGRMPEEPLIFVEVALVREVATCVQALLDESQPTLGPEQATTAIFYSISNAQAGLRGVSMGEFLIKRVVQQLMQEFPKLRTFATLSPIPGFGRWLDKRLNDQAYLTSIPAELDKQLTSLGKSRNEAIPLLLAREIDGDHPAQVQLQAWLKSECAYYLLNEKSKNHPLDPVARFHFSNGASLGQINWLADTSRQGLRQSAGLMVNYLYKLREIESNHRAYANNDSLAAAGEVEKLREAASQRRRIPTSRNRKSPPSTTTILKGQIS